MTTKAPARPRLSDSCLARMWAKVDFDGPCWLWTAGTDRAGYGVFNTGEAGVTRAAHRLVWMTLVGPIAAGLDLDHLCRVHRCVNPDHLEPVTRRVNLLRGATLTAAKARQTHCVNGHEFAKPNTYWTPGRGTRQCVTCRSLTKRGT